jgi:hypothetical protein
VDNTGQRKLFVSNILFKSPSYTETRVLGRQVDGGDLAIFESRVPVGPHLYRCIVGPIAKDVQDGRAEVPGQRFHWYTDGHPTLTNHNQVEHALLPGTARLVYRVAGETNPREVEVKCTVIVVQYPNANGQYSDEILAFGKAKLEPTSFQFHPPAPPQPTPVAPQPTPVIPAP